MILVTGATGRIGHVLVGELNKKYGKVKVFVREKSNLKPLEGSNCEYVYGDILDIDSLRRAFEGVDTVFHLAAHINISFYDKKKTLNTNVEGTKNVVEVCMERGISLIYTSSIHALSTLDDVITERSKLCTDTDEKRGIYDQSKSLATKEVLSAIEKGLRAIILIPTGVIGPSDYRPSSFGLGMIQSVKMGLSSTLEGRYDYVDVRDVVSGIVRAYDLKKYGEMYMLSGHLLDMKTYVEYLREFSGVSKLKPLGLVKKSLAMFLGFVMGFFNKRSTITPYSVATLHSNSNISHQKATEELGYHPRGIKESLYDQYMWFKNNKYI
ncbi:NAD-dependent epimerase/dehydratase family protein [Candidatus Dojkabacteria bacterium]|uniref:NAD-dependent epimerase/dehydratase family protein n=1 Tax=Candidatus Dojkabacteria bacterium TaxID=2099670 RepID=A0A847VCU5_9BACT|nr:NAD-dependent epimerase/dehydratase family protein [Candidatus Dojkabacteria bacterium]